MHKPMQKYKIYGRKKGRQFTEDVNVNLLKNFLLEIPSDLINKKIILDIGSGNGENAILLSKKHPDKLIITSDIFQDGNYNLSRKLKLNNLALGDIKLTW